MNEKNIIRSTVASQKSGLMGWTGDPDSEKSRFPEVMCKSAARPIRSDGGKPYILSLLPHADTQGHFNTLAHQLTVSQKTKLVPGAEASFFDAEFSCILFLTFIV